MRNWIFIVLVLFSTTLFGQENWKGVYSSGGLNLYRGVYFSGVDIAYLQSRTKQNHYKYWELTDLVYGTYRKTNANVKTFRVGIGYGMGLYFKETLGIMKFRFSHSLGMYYLKTETSPLSSHLYDENEKSIALYYKPKLQTEFALNSKISTVLGISGFLEAALRSNYRNNVFLEPDIRKNNYIFLNLELARIEIGLQYKL